MTALAVYLVRSLLMCRHVTSEYYAVYSAAEFIRTVPMPGSWRITTSQK